MSASRAASRSVGRLDPRAPFVLDTRELGRRAGSMRRVERTSPAPDGWGLELVSVPAGTEIRLELRLEAVMDGVLVSGTAHALVHAECGRCLAPVSTEVDVEVQELFAYEATEADEDYLLVGDFLDLEPVVRDAVLLGLPLNPVCREDCEGLCPGCGEALADLPADHHHDEIDPRWAALASLDTDNSAGDAPAVPEMGS